MPKIRTVKPELFRHIDLFMAEKKYKLPLRLAFIGLFTCCDREGRFRYEPHSLKLDILPYDDVDFEKTLEVLWEEGFIKRLAYSSFYRFLKQISTINIPLDSGDFAMISRRVANLMMKMPEESRFLRGMRTWVGFKQIGYEYERDERAMGSPKYTFKQLWQLAKNGIFNFSEAPIKLMKRAGYATIFFSFCYAIYILYQKFVVGAVPPGFTTLYLFLMVFAGLQFLFLGLIGEYILRIFFQVKQRPLFIVSNQIVDGQLQVLDYE